MSEFIGRGRKARRCYGFDEIALVPGEVTINPNEVDTSWPLDGQRYRVPILASAMDGVVDVKFAIAFGKLGGLAVLNLEGIQTRYEDPEEILSKLVKAQGETATKIIQSIYREPIKEKLITKRIQEIKKAKVPAAVSAIPQRAQDFGPIAQEPTGHGRLDLAISASRLQPYLWPHDQRPDVLLGSQRPGAARHWDHGLRGPLLT